MPKKQIPHQCKNPLCKHFWFQRGKRKPRICPKCKYDLDTGRRLVNAFRGEGFKLRNEALGDDEMRKAIIESKKTALRSWCKGVIDIAELAPLREQILASL